MSGNRFAFFSKKKNHTHPSSIDRLSVLDSDKLVIPNNQNPPSFNPGSHNNLKYNSNDNLITRSQNKIPVSDSPSEINIARRSGNFSQADNINNSKAQISIPNDKILESNSFNHPIHNQDTKSIIKDNSTHEKVHSSPTSIHFYVNSISNYNSKTPKISFQNANPSNSVSSFLNKNVNNSISDSNYSSQKLISPTHVPNPLNQSSEFSTLNSSSQAIPLSDQQSRNYFPNKNIEFSNPKIIDSQYNNNSISISSNHPNVIKLNSNIRYASSIEAIPQSSISNNLPLVSPQIQIQPVHSNIVKTRYNSQTNDSILNYPSKNSLVSENLKRPSSSSQSPLDLINESKRLKESYISPSTTDSNSLSEINRHVEKVKSSFDSETVSLESTGDSLLKTIDSLNYDLSSREVVRDLRLLLSLAQESAKFLLETCGIIEKRVGMLVNHPQIITNNTISESSPTAQVTPSNPQAQPPKIISHRSNINPLDERDKISKILDSPIKFLSDISKNIANNGDTTDYKPQIHSDVKNIPESSNTLSKIDSSSNPLTIIPNTPSRPKVKHKLSADNVDSANKINLKDFSNSSNSIVNDKLDICYRSKRDILYSLQSIPIKAFRRKPRGLLVKEIFASDSSSSMSAVTGSLDGSLQFWNVESMSMLIDGCVNFPKKQFPEHLSMVSNNTICALLSKTGDESNPENSISKSRSNNEQNPSDNENSLALITIDSISSKSVDYSINYIPTHDSRQKRSISVVSAISGGYYSDGGPIVFATAGYDKRLDLWNIEFDSFKRPFANGVYPIASCHSSSIQALEFERTRSWLFSGGSDCRLQVTDLGSESINNIVIHPENPNILMINYASVRDQFRLIDLRAPLFTPKVALQFGYPSDKNQSRYVVPSFDPEGKYVISGLHDTTEGEGGLFLWDIRFTNVAKTTPQSISIHEKRVISTQFVPNEKKLLTISSDNTLTFTEYKTTVATK
ncbi:hypothetical protein AYI68_g5561 [Smittium mucronatum]|uniref:WD repeat-containing protein n=1 Tax=Smittium mucronatum TaxID=133383 RepID=A0A1R0GTY3_9FUNG|nr:hypothetical protein AYI68_g5561 [Smittium mucronatum]